MNFVNTRLHGATIKKLELFLKYDPLNRGICFVMSGPFVLIIEEHYIDYNDQKYSLEYGRKY